MAKLKTTSIILLIILLFTFQTAFAEKKGKLPPKNPIPVSKNYVPSAVAHYMKARAYLVEAVREFDKGVELDKPDQRLDVKGFRNSVLDQADALEKYVAPKAREE